MSVSPKKAITAQLPNAIAASPGLYVAPVNTRSIVKKLTFTNTDTVPRLLTVHLVPSGSSGSAANILTKAFPIGAGMTYECFEAAGHVLMPGDFITAFSDVASVVTCQGSVVDVV